MTWPRENRPSFFLAPSLPAKLFFGPQEKWACSQTSSWVALLEGPSDTKSRPESSLNASHALTDSQNLDRIWQTQKGRPETPCFGAPWDLITDGAQQPQESDRAWRQRLRPQGCTAFTDAGKQHGLGTCQDAHPYLPMKCHTHTGTGCTYREEAQQRQHNAGTAPQGQ